MQHTHTAHTHHFLPDPDNLLMPLVGENQGSKLGSGSGWFGTAMKPPRDRCSFACASERFEFYVNPGDWAS